MYSFYMKSSALGFRDYGKKGVRLLILYHELQKALNRDGGMIHQPQLLIRKLQALKRTNARYCNGYGRRAPP